MLHIEFFPRKVGSYKKYSINEKQVERVCRELGLKVSTLKKRELGGPCISWEKLTNSWLALLKCGQHKSSLLFWAAPCHFLARELGAVSKNPFADGRSMLSETFKNQIQRLRV